MNLNRIQVIVAQVFAPRAFERALLYRIKADTSFFPHLTKYEAPKGLMKELKTIWRICIEDIDNFLEAFDILTTTPITVNDAQAFCNTYLMSAGVSTGLVGSTLSHLTLLSIPFIANALRKLYNHYLTKTPSMLPPLLVYSDPNFYQCVAPINNRDHVLREIMIAWEQRVTPILVGEPGCGKTSILIEVARRIHQGAFPRFSGKGYKVFGGSAISLTKAGGMWGGENLIGRIFKKISEKKEHTILLLDEIHTFNDEHKAQLRDYFDHSPRSISYAVFATTHVGAQEFFRGDDGSLERRFRRIRIPELNLQEAEYALHQEARSIAPLLITHAEVIHLIVEHTKGKLAPSRKILCRLLRKASENKTIHALQQAYNDKLSELNLIKEEHFKEVYRAQTSDSQGIEKIYQLEQEKRVLHKKLTSECQVGKQHVTLLAKRVQVIFKIFDISQKISSLFQDYLSCKGESWEDIRTQVEERYFTSSEFIDRISDLMKEFIYYNYSLLPMLVKQIGEFEEEHALMSEIKPEFLTEEDLAIEEPITTQEMTA
jgi:DNA polymerase III delta prime subunit